MAAERINTPEVFVTHPRLISVDGPDGVGKGTFCGVLGSMLKEILGDSGVVVTSGTRFEASSVSQKLGKALEKAPDPVARNRLFLLSTRQIFREVVIPALKQGKVVILDSSTLRHLAYTFDKNGPDNPVFWDTQKMIAKGTLDFHLLPGIRIILRSSDEGLLKNLQGRENTDVGDPTNLDQVRNRIEAYRKAIEIMSDFRVSGQTTLVELENPSLPKERVREGLSRIIRKSVFPKLTFLER